MVLPWIILFSFLGSVGTILTASFFLLLKENIQNMLVPYLISYASGTLITAALLGLIPEGLERLDAHSILATVLIGIILFFILENLVIWHHCHDQECDRHKTVGPMILIGDVFHNAVDGLVITASFLISIPFGILASILFGPARRTSISLKTKNALFFAWSPYAMDKEIIRSHLNEISQNLNSVFESITTEIQLIRP